MTRIAIVLLLTVLTLPMPSAAQTLQLPPASSRAIALWTTPEMGTVTSTLLRARGRQFDRVFLTIFVAHHQAAIRMSRPMMRTTEDTQVRAWARNTIETERAGISGMQRLLGEIGGADPTVRQLMQRQLSRIPITTRVGVGSDIAYVSQLLVHHASAIALAATALAMSEHPDIIRLARNAITTYNNEVFQFREWLSRQ